MKLICRDNFNRDSVSDTLIGENINEFYGKHIKEFLNDKFSGSTSPYFFDLVNDDYKLYIFEP